MQFFVMEEIGSYRVATEDEVATVALCSLENKLKSGSESFSTPGEVRQYARLRIGSYEHEVFAIGFLDSRHRLIEFVEMFRGTISQTSVYPREVVKEALRLNAGAVILFHNHPSGDCRPSRADENVTQTLKSALALVDVRVLDHIIVSATGAVSMAEIGLV